MVGPAVYSSNKESACAEPVPARFSGAGPVDEINKVVQGIASFALSGAEEGPTEFCQAVHLIQNAMRSEDKYPATVVAAFLFGTEQECRVQMSRMEYLLPLEKDSDRIFQSAELLGELHCLSHGNERHRDAYIAQLLDLEILCGAGGTLSFNTLTLLKPFEQPTVVLCDQPCKTFGSSCPVVQLHQDTSFPERLDLLRTAVAKAVASMPFTALEIVPVTETEWNRIKPAAFQLTAAEATQKFLADLLALNPKAALALCHIAIEETVFVNCMWDEALSKIFTSQTVKTIKILGVDGAVPDLQLHGANYPELQKKLRL